MPSDQQAFVGPRIWDQPRASLVAPDGKESACNAGDPGSIELVVKICKKNIISSQFCHRNIKERMPQP